MVETIFWVLLMMIGYYAIGFGSSWTLFRVWSKQSYKLSSEDKAKLNTVLVVNCFVWPLVMPVILMVLLASYVKRIIKR
jgi:hypothetical protein